MRIAAKASIGAAAVAAPLRRVGAPHGPSKTGVNALVMGAPGGHKGRPYAMQFGLYWLNTSLRKRAIATLYSRSARSSDGLLGLVKAWVVPL